MPAGVSDAKRSLFSYTIAARTGGKEVLFEVRADGVAHSLFAYPAAPDPGKLLYVDMSLESGAATAAPTGKSELAAAAAVAAVMAKAKPGERIEVLMYGYHFAFIGADGQPVATSNGQPFEITIDPMGNLSAWT